MTYLLCFLVIFASHFLLCRTKPVGEWHTFSGEDTSKYNPIVMRVNEALLPKPGHEAF